MYNEEMSKKCEDCLNWTACGCALEKHPENCETDIPLPLAMEIGMI